jgi:peptidoglycan/xylan/chitin deacetylase (PgdA/CDA1 family)
MAVPVLLYHCVADDREVTPAGFERQLKYLFDKGYFTPPLADFLAYLRGEKTLPDKSVLLTFDDGYADNWICAYPLLKKYGFRGIVFLTTKHIVDFAPRSTLADGAKSPETLKDLRGPQGFLSWQELRVMVDTGVFDVGSHTETHNFFDKRRKWEDMPGELLRSSKTIENRLGFKPISVAWPWGHFDQQFTDAAKAAGYQVAFTTKPGANVPGDDPMLVKRFKVQNGNICWLAPRMLLYRCPLLANAYGSVYGLDRTIKNKLLDRD